MERAQTRGEIDLLAAAFPAQRAFISDPASLKFAFCTRRAAKSYAVGLEHIDSAMRLGGKHLILGLTRESVRGSFWTDVLKAIDTRHRLGLQFNESRLEVTTPGGGTIRLLGMDANEGEARKALGQKYRKVAIDEAQDFRSDLQQLVFATLKPAVTDYAGSISLTGTPSNQIRGFYYDLTTGKIPGWSAHRWTSYDNPHISQQWAAQIASLEAATPRVREAPWFRQQFLGEWVVEHDALVYRYLEGRNDFDGSLPAFSRGRWNYVLGLDLGYTDATAWTVVAYHDHSRTLYVLESDKEAGLDITATAARVRQLQARYEFDRIVVDNANKQAVEEMKRRHGLPLHAADKTGKSDFIELLNADLTTGQLVLGPNANALREEWRTLIWDPKAEKREEHPGCPNHCADSALYAWRHAYQFLSERIPERPAVGTPAHVRQLEDEMEQAAERSYRESQDPDADLI